VEQTRNILNSGWSV